MTHKEALEKIIEQYEKYGHLLNFDVNIARESLKEQSERMYTQAEFQEQVKFATDSYERGWADQMRFYNQSQPSERMYSERMYSEEEVLEILVKFGGEIIKSTKYCSVLIPNYRKFLQSLSQKDKPTSSTSTETGADAYTKGVEDKPTEEAKCPNCINLQGQHLSPDCCHNSSVEEKSDAGSSIQAMNVAISEYSNKKCQAGFQSGFQSALDSIEEIINETLTRYNCDTPSKNALLNKIQSLKK